MLCCQAKPSSAGKKPSQDQRETQPGVTQTGRERGGGREGERYEVREERGIETEKKKEWSRPGVAQTAREEREVTEVAIGGETTNPLCKRGTFFLPRIGQHTSNT